MSRLETFEPETEVDVVEDQDEKLLKLWVMAGYYAQNFTILVFLAACCGILFYHF